MRRTTARYLHAFGFRICESIQKLPQALLNECTVSRFQSALSKLVRSRLEASRPDWHSTLSPRIPFDSHPLRNFWELTFISFKIAEMTWNNCAAICRKVNNAKGPSWNLVRYQRSFTDRCRYTEVSFCGSSCASSSSDMRGTPCCKSTDVEKGIASQNTLDANMVPFDVFML